jgi:transposase InsO family protein
MCPLPLSKGRYKYVLSVIDHFTKYVEFFPIESTTALESAQVILENICKYGVPESILTDRGSNYQSELVQELWELLDIHGLRTTAFRPQTDGESERNFRTLQIMIAAYVNEKKDDWTLLQFAYNSAIHSTHKFSPFELTYG